MQKLRLCYEARRCGEQRIIYDHLGILHVHRNLHTRIFSWKTTPAAKSKPHPGDQQHYALATPSGQERQERVL